MTEPFEEEEFFEDEWVDVYDVEGHKASLRHLATIRHEGKAYMILGETPEEFEQKGRLLLVREEETVDGVTQYVMVHDAPVIEQVMSRFAMHLLMDHLDDLPPEIAQELEQLELSAQISDMDKSCGCSHRPGEFCFCGIPAYLQ